MVGRRNPWDPESQDRGQVVNNATQRFRSSNGALNYREKSEKAQGARRWFKIE